MPKIIYYVATSIDGYIAGPEDEIDGFENGPGVDKYLEDLKSFRTTIMGRRTYEFGYRYGLEPGQPAYPHMQHHIFSRSLAFDAPHPAVHIEPIDLGRIQEIRAASPTDIYLCGGGTFAGWLLENGQIDQLKIKLNPFILGEGIRLFGASKQKTSWKLAHFERFDAGPQVLTYDRVDER